MVGSILATVLALVLGAAGAVGAAALDQQFVHARFTIDPVRRCPLAVHGQVSTPMCAPTQGW